MIIIMYNVFDVLIVLIIVAGLCHLKIAESFSTNLVMEKMLVRGLVGVKVTVNGSSNSSSLE